jgi:osmotically inducible protein OsmC
MADAQRTAHAVWEGSLTRGAGAVTLTSSGAAASLPVTWASRTARSEGKTSPEELVAAAHASCYCMALSHVLGEAGTPPEKLETSVTVTFTEIEGGWKTGSSHITVKGMVPGVDEAAFKEAGAAVQHLLGRLLSDEQLDELVERFNLDMGLRWLRSRALDKRVRGVKYIRKIVGRSLARAAGACGSIRSAPRADTVTTVMACRLRLASKAAVAVRSGVSSSTWRPWVATTSPTSSA